jgi:hypothetical protein
VQAYPELAPFGCDLAANFAPTAEYQELPTALPAKNYRGRTVLYLHIDRDHATWIRGVQCPSCNQREARCEGPCARSSLSRLATGCARPCPRVTVADDLALLAPAPSLPLIFC